MREENYHSTFIFFSLVIHKIVGHQEDELIEETFNN